MPEMVVSIFSSAKGEGDLAISNIAGSNVANILLILGVGAVVRPLSVHRTVVYREIIFNVLASLMLIILIADVILLPGNGQAGLDQIDGAVLISYFLLFLYYSFNRIRLFAMEDAIKADSRHRQLFLSIAKVVLGATGLFLGGQWIVNGAVDVARLFNISEALIGASLVAIGTSLPELTTTLIAIRKNKADIAVGNAVGSNLFNVLWVLGLSAIIRPISLRDETLFDVFFAAVTAIVLFLTMVLGRYRHQISRSEGALFIGAYFIYLTTALILGLNH